MSGATGSTFSIAQASTPIPLSFNETARTVTPIDQTIPGFYQFYIYVTNDAGTSIFTTAVNVIELVCGPITLVGSENMTDTLL